MKNSFLIFFLIITSLSASSQNWVDDFETAKKQAVTENKHVLLIFEGSDWCPPCKKLNKNILSTTAFKTYASENLILVKADFLKRSPVSKKQMAQNELLLKKYNPKRKLPKLFMLDSKGKVLGNLGYKKISAEAYVKILKDLSV